MTVSLAEERRQFTAVMHRTRLTIYELIRACGCQPYATTEEVYQALAGVGAGAFKKLMDLGLELDTLLNDHTVSPADAVVVMRTLRGHRLLPVLVLEMYFDVIARARPEGTPDEQMKVIRGWMTEYTDNRCNPDLYFHYKAAQRDAANLQKEKP